MIRKKILLTLLFIVLLTSFRLIWLDFFDVGKISSIQDGQIHLMKQKTGELEIIRLSEDWEFYPDQLITPEEINHAGAPQDNLSIQFPDLHHVKDIEEKNKKLHQFNKSRDDFLANTSNEMRNPLHSMIHIAQYVLDNRENKIINKDRQDLTLLIQVGKRMSMLINDLIDLSQIREHNLRLDKKVVYLHGQVKVVLDMLAHVIEGKQVQVLNQVSPSFPPIVADENRLNQILLNLVHNALKFTEESTITIQAKVAGDMAVIEVIDTGKGIDNVDFEKYFSSI